MKKAKQTKQDKFVSCAGSARSLTSSEAGMSKNKRWTQVPGPAGNMLKAKSHNAMK